MSARSPHGIPPDPFSAPPRARRAPRSPRRRSPLDALGRLPPERRRLIERRGGPALAALALLGLVLGLVAGAGPSERERTAERFAQAWERGDHAAMHAMLTPAAQRRVSRAELRDAYREAAATATLARLAAEDPEEDGDEVAVPVVAHTRVFGPVQGEVRLPIQGRRVEWARHLAFPSVPQGAELARRSVVPRRADILAGDGRPLARGPADSRTSSLGAVAASVAGEVSRPKGERARLALYARGFPRDGVTGTSGLERAFELRVAGTPGGELRAGRRVLARARPRPGRPVRSAIDTRVQGAATQALGGRLGGIFAMDPRSGEVRALAGVAFSAPQPPGSVFKVITTAAALEAGVVKPSDRFPVRTKAVIDGVDLENANGESCGGTFTNSFAHSCNSVFAPLGVELGARRLVAAAERFGFNRRPVIPGAAMSTLPPASEMRSPLEVGSTAIGQGRILTTPLLMAQSAQAVADGGVMREPVLESGGRPARPPRRVMRPETADRLRRLMIAVVQDGTGTSASLAPDAQVAGKTGTAELENTADGAPVEGDAGADTNAWFIAFAPARRPRLAVGVMFVRAGAGGETAAPAAREVFRAALR